MNEQKKLSFMKISCWIGVVADALWAVALLCPTFYGLLIGIPDFNPSIQHQIDMGIAASLMTGWTFLLVWAAQKPVERKGVLLLTAFPVIFGIFMTTYAGVCFGITSIENVLWIFIKVVILFVMYVTSYLFGRGLNRKSEDLI